MDMRWYILEGKIPKPVNTISEYLGWMELNPDRHVKSDHLPDGVHVSTVFLCLDHNYGAGSPLLFETMIFGGEYDQYMQRYSTWKEAELGHQNAIDKIFEVNQHTKKLQFKTP